MSNKMNQNLPTIIIGAGGHARMLADTLTASGANILGFTDLEIKAGTKIFEDYIVLGSDNILDDFSIDEIDVAIGVGFLPQKNWRKAIFEKIRNKGFKIRTVIHPSVIIGSNILLGEGVQLIAGTIIQTGCKIGKNVIINTGAKIDHDVTIGDFSHIAPGATICGDVKIGENCFIGAGSTIIQGINIGHNVTIGAGVLVRADIASHEIYIG
ncbi:MAG: acetyltransferase [Ignavibacteriae bacterium]|nr:acetyltransferase [Ignavibacteriota bacterium]